MKLRQMKGEFSIGRYNPGAEFKPLFSRKFCSITRTPDEVTIVCESDLLPEGYDAREDGWACLEIDGEIDFSLGTLLKKVARSIGTAELAIFAVSTFDTDYVLIKAKTLGKAKESLRAAGVSVR